MIRACNISSSSTVPCLSIYPLITPPPQLLFLFAALLDFCEERVNYYPNTAGMIHLSLTLASQRHRLFLRKPMSVCSPNIAPLCVYLCFYTSHLFPRLPLYSRHQHPVDNAGLFSFMTLHWLSPLAVKAYKASSLSIDDVWGLSCHEASAVNCQRWGNCAKAEVCLMKGTCGVGKTLFIVETQYSHNTGTWWGMK